MQFIIDWNMLQRDFENLSFSISKEPLKQAEIVQTLMSKKYNVKGRSEHFSLSRTNIGWRTSTLRVTLDATIFFLFFLFWQLNPFIENPESIKNLILPHRQTQWGPGPMTPKKIIKKNYYVYFVFLIADPINQPRAQLNPKK